MPSIEVRGRLKSPLHIGSIPGERATTGQSPGRCLNRRDAPGAGRPCRGDFSRPLHADHRHAVNRSPRATEVAPTHRLDPRRKSHHRPVTGLILEPPRCAGRAGRPCRGDFSRPPHAYHRHAINRSPRATEVAPTYRLDPRRKSHHRPITGLMLEPPRCAGRAGRPCRGDFSRPPHADHRHAVNRSPRATEVAPTYRLDSRRESHHRPTGGRPCRGDFSRPPHADHRHAVNRSPRATEVAPTYRLHPRRESHHRPVTGLILEPPGCTRRAGRPCRGDFSRPPHADHRHAVNRSPRATEVAPTSPPHVDHRETKNPPCLRRAGFLPASRVTPGRHLSARACLIRRPSWRTWREQRWC
jgi:hypothetical protein